MSLVPLKQLPNDGVIHMDGPLQSFFHWVAYVNNDISMLGIIGGIGLPVDHEWEWLIDSQ